MYLLTWGKNVLQFYMYVFDQSNEGGLGTALSLKGVDIIAVFGATRFS